MRPDAVPFDCAGDTGCLPAPFSSAEAAEAIPGVAPGMAAGAALGVTQVHLLRLASGASLRTSLHSSLLLDHLRTRARALGRSARTERAYVYWARHFIWHTRESDLRGLGRREWDSFHIHLAYRWRLSASTQRQASSALRFFYREVLGRLPPGLPGRGHRP